MQLIKFSLNATYAFFNRDAKINLDKRDMYYLDSYLEREFTWLGLTAFRSAATGAPQATNY